MSKKNRQDQRPSGAAASAAAKPSRLADYFWANLVFFAFLFVLAMVVRSSSEAPGDDPAVKQVLDETFKFFLLLMGGGFLVVTLFDAGYEFFAAQAGEDAEADELAAPAPSAGGGAS
jgi:hypothetical protein